MLDRNTVKLVASEYDVLVGIDASPAARLARAAAIAERDGPEAGLDFLSTTPKVLISDASSSLNLLQPSMLLNGL